MKDSYFILLRQPTMKNKILLATTSALIGLTSIQYLTTLAQADPPAVDVCSKVEEFDDETLTATVKFEQNSGSSCKELNVFRLGLDLDEPPYFIPYDTTATVHNDGTLYGGDDRPAFSSQNSRQLFIESFINDTNGLITSLYEDGITTRNQAIQSNARFGSFVNKGRIEGKNTADAAVKFEEGSIETFENLGSITSEHIDSVAFRVNNNRVTINRLINRDRGLIKGGVNGADIRVGRGDRINVFENQQGRSSGNADDPIDYIGYLPEFYNVIIDGSNYGQLRGAGIAGDSRAMIFGISEEYSAAVLADRYASVLINIDADKIANEEYGKYEERYWYLEEVSPGTWDLVFALPDDPSKSQATALTLTSRALEYAEKFDNSRLMMHLVESRRRGQQIVPTADVISSGEASDDGASMSSTIGGTTVFANVRGAWVDFNDTDVSSAFSTTAFGVTGGVEHRFDSLHTTLGLFGSYSDTDNANSTESDKIESIGVGVLASTELGGGFWLDGYGAYYHHNHDIVREEEEDTYTGETDGRTWAMFGRLSYDVEWLGIDFIPYLAARYIDQKTNGYEESGNDEAAIEVGEDTVTNTISYVGATVATDFALSESATLLPKVDVSWVHLMNDGERSVTASWVDQEAIETLTVGGSDQDFARIEASLGVAFDNGFAMRVDYATELWNSDVESLHEVRLEATYQF